MKTTALALCALVALMSGCSKKAAPEGAVKPLKIGVVAVQTGPMAAVGQAFLDAIKLAVADEAALGRKIELVVEDDGLQPAKAAAAGRKLLEVDRVDGLISFTSGTANALAPLAAKAKVVHMAISSDTKPAELAYNFINLTPPAEESKKMVAELQRRQITRVAYFGLKIQGVEAIYASLTPALQKAGISVVWQDQYAAGEKDFRVKLTKMAAAKPQAAIVLAFTPELDAIIKQSGETAPGVELTSIEAFDYAGDRALVEGKWMVTVAMGSKEFRGRIKEKTGREATACAAFGYDSLRLISLAYAVNSAPGAHYQWLQEVKDYQGAVGSLRFDNKRVAIVPADVVTIKNGATLPVE